MNIKELERKQLFYFAIGMGGLLLALGPLFVESSCTFLDISFEAMQIIALFTGSAIAAIGVVLYWRNLGQRLAFYRNQIYT
jgi:hypothetical protein